MNRLTMFKNAIALLVVVLAVNGCGLATSNEERIARAEAQMAAGEYRAAMIELKNVLASDIDNPSARILLAKVSLGLGDVPAAEKELERAAELQAPEAAVRTLHFDILMAKGMYADVLAALGMEVGGLTQEQQLSYRGEALLGLNNPTAAMTVYEDWLQLDPSSVDADLGIALTEILQNELDSAVTRLDRIAAAEPENVKAWQALATAYYRQGDFAGAESAFERAATVIRPQSDVLRYTRILYGLIESQLALDNREAARLNVARAMGVAPNAPPTLFLAARLARSDDDYEMASRHLQTLLTISPDNSQAALFLANMQMMLGNFAQAERLLQRVIALTPGNITARKLLAQVQLRKSEPEGAIEALASLFDTDADDPDLYITLARANLQQGEASAVAESLRKAVELAPNDMELKLDLAAAYLGASQVDLALEVLTNMPEGAGVNIRRERLLAVGLVIAGRQAEADAVAEDLVAGAAPSELASQIASEHYFRTGRTDRAREILVDLIASRPDSLKAKIGLATIELTEGNVDTAAKLFSSVVEVDEDNIRALIGLAEIQRLAGEADEMVRLLKQAVDADDQAVNPRALLASYYLNNENFIDGEELANELVAIGFRSPEIRTVVAGLFAGVGRTEEAVAHFQQAAKQNPDSPAPQLGLARAYLTQDRLHDARSALQRALELRPGWPVAMATLTLIELGQGEVEAASDMVAEFRANDPESVTGMVLEGEVLLLKQDYSGAAQAFRRAVESGGGRTAMLREYQAMQTGGLPNADEMLKQWLENEPDDTLTRSVLALHYATNNDAVQAIREYERVLQIEPGNVTVMNNLAWHYQQSGDLGRAVELAEAAYEAAPESGAVADTLGWIYRDRGQLDKSAELLREASRLAPNDGEIQYHYAVVLVEVGRKTEAIQVLQRLANRDIEFPSREKASELLTTL